MAFDVLSFAIGRQTAKGGSGGGSASGGCYFTTDEMGFPNDYARTMFHFGGEDYCLACTSTATSNGTIALYKNENGAWVEKGSVLTGLINGYNYGGMTQVEFNGKLHLYLEHNATHLVFDGTTMKKLNNLPAEYMYLFEDDGRLVCGSGDYYVWDESTDTWTKENTNVTVYITCAFTVNNVAYLKTNQQKLYTYHRGTLTDTGYVFTKSITYGIVLNNKIYYISMSSYVNRQYPFMCFDPATMTETYISTLPKFRTNVVRLYNRAGKIRMYTLSEYDNVSFEINLPE